MKKSKLYNLINDKFKLMDTAPSIFRDGARIIEERLLKSTLSILNKFTLKNGFIDKKDLTNKKLLSLLNKRIKQALAAQPFKSTTNNFLKAFDTLTDINLKILEGVNDLSQAELKRLNISTEKQLAIEEISNSLIDETMRNNNLGKPIRKILYRHVTRGIKRSEAETEIRNFIKGKKELGLVENYVRTLSTEALRNYDGAIAHQAAKEFDLQAFRIINPLIRNSQISCVEMVTGTGAIGKLRINGKYLIKDIPKIIAIASKRKGWNKNANKNNYFSLGNHWGCRHSFTVTRLLKRDKKLIDSFDENVEEDIEEINKVEA